MNRHCAGGLDPLPPTLTYIDVYNRVTVVCTYWFVLHRGAGDTPIEFVVIYYTRIYQRLHRHLILEQ